MDAELNSAASGGDFYIWIVMFSILIVGVAYLAYLNKGIKR